MFLVFLLVVPSDIHFSDCFSARFNDGRFRVTTEAQPPSTRSLRLHWPLVAVGVGRGYDRGEPSGAAVAAARRAASPLPEQMDRKMLRFVEKTWNSHRQNAPSAEDSDLGALPFGCRPQPPLSCNPLLSHAFVQTMPVFRDAEPVKNDFA